MSILIKNSVSLQVHNIRSSNSNMFNVVRDYFESTFRAIWHNPDFTPQQIFDEFGTDAADLFDAANAAVQLLVTLDPTYVPPSPPNLFTINPDRTVTVGMEIQTS